MSIPKESNLKKFSFLATGTELIEGDVQDSNCRQFAQLIHNKGGEIYQHIQTSDRKEDIIQALKYLLNHSDVVIVTGGLGPTSDDTTRYALSEVTEKKLYFDETAWDHVVTRLKRFNLLALEPNRQQALFPEGATLYQNEHGTAFGAYVQWDNSSYLPPMVVPAKVEIRPDDCSQLMDGSPPSRGRQFKRQGFARNKHIFMLPGPPKECIPMFEQQVLPTLEALDFFEQKKIYKWLTLGLVEGEIAAAIDKMIENYRIESGYRWNYPYLEIKLASYGADIDEKLILDIEEMLLPYLVSKNSEDAVGSLWQQLKSFKSTIYLLDEITNNHLFSEIPDTKLVFLDKKKADNCKEVLFHVRSSPQLDLPNHFDGSIIFECDVHIEKKLVYQHAMATPNRGPEVIECARAYVAWQICQFIKQT